MDDAGFLPLDNHEALAGGGEIARQQPADATEATHDDMSYR
ncbi:MAG: hypothetical protein WDM77_09690 [Steroidobacteraceae bacterium]